MYRELLKEFNDMKAAGEDMETFASDVLMSMEKQAFLAGAAKLGLGALKFVAKAPIGVAKGAGKFATNAVKDVGLAGKALFGGPVKGLPGRLFNRNLDMIKTYGAAGAAMSAIPVAAGQQSVVDAAGDFFTGGAFSGVRQIGHDIKQTTIQNRMPIGMMRHAEETQDLLVKLAADDKDPIKSIIANVAAIGGLGLGGYAGASLIGKLLSRNPQIAKGVSVGIDRALGNIGKGTMKTFGRTRPFTAVANAAITGAGKIAEKLDPNAGKIRTNFGTITGRPEKSTMLRNLGLYLGTMTGVSIAEDYITDRITNGLNAIKPKDNKAIPSDEVEIIDTTGGDRPRRTPRYDGTRERPGFGDRPRTPRYGDRPSYGDRPRTPRYGDRPAYDRGARTGSERPFRDKEFGQDSRAPRTDEQEEQFAFHTHLGGLEKLAISNDTKRLLGDRMLRPAVTTGAFILSLAGLSRLIGRNLYGGFEKVKHDKDVYDTGRIVIDIPSSELKDRKGTALVKKASVSRLEKIKAALDKKIVNGPKFVRKVDNLLASKEAVRYQGKTGLAHMIAEEVPFKILEGVAYSAPLAAVALLTGRNAKRAFEPIVSTTGAPAGMTRITIEEKRDDGKQEKKAASLDDLILGIIKNPARPYITNNLKKLQEKKAADEHDEHIEILDKAFPNELERKVAYMIATSHEYKKPNTDAAIAFVKNYRWELSTAKVSDLQGIDKPIIEEKVEDMVKTIKEHEVAPFITVNNFHGVRPQTPGKKILVDGHHRKEACLRAGISEVPIYKGIYTGDAEKSTKELVGDV